MENPNIDTVVFDLGGVLIDWNPEYLYRKVFETEDEVQHFLQEICTPHWNEQQDAGRTLKEATDLLVAQHPGFAREIRAFYDRWEEMLGGPIPSAVRVLEDIHQRRRHRLYALTNWSHETFPVAIERFPFLQLFEGILVSGSEKLKKPDPRIYQLLIDRYRINPPTALYIDDNASNVRAAGEAGFQAIHFQEAAQLREELQARGVLS